MSTSLAAPAAPALLYTQPRIRTALGLSMVEDIREPVPPAAGQFRFWSPSWSVSRILHAGRKAGLIVTENDVAKQPFSKPEISAGYYTVPLTPPTCGSGKYRKPTQLKSGEYHAPLNVMLMAVLTRYVLDAEDFCPNVWLATADNINGKVACLMVVDGTLLVEMHDERLVATNGHATAVCMS